MYSSKDFLLLGSDLSFDTSEHDSFNDLDDRSLLDRNRTIVELESQLDARELLVIMGGIA